MAPVPALALHRHANQFRAVSPCPQPSIDERAQSRSRVFSVAAILFAMGCSLRAAGANRKPVLLLQSGRVHPKPFSSKSTPSPIIPTDLLWLATGFIMLMAAFLAAAVEIGVK
jgi:hypothetical protein